MSAFAAAPASRSPGLSRRLPTAGAGAALGLAIAALAWRLSPIDSARSCRARRPGSSRGVGTGRDLGRSGIDARRLGVWARRADRRRGGGFRPRRGSAGTGIRPRRARTVRLRHVQSGRSGAMAARRARRSRARLPRHAPGGARRLQHLLRPGVPRPDDRGLHVLPQGVDRGRLVDRLRPRAVADRRSRGLDEGGLFLGAGIGARPRHGGRRTAFPHRLSDGNPRLLRCAGRARARLAGAGTRPPRRPRAAGPRLARGCSRSRSSRS